MIHYNNIKTLHNWWPDHGVKSTIFFIKSKQNLPISKPCAHRIRSRFPRVPPAALGCYPQTGIATQCIGWLNPLECNQSSLQLAVSTFDSLRRGFIYWENLPKWVFWVRFVDFASNECLFKRTARWFLSFKATKLISDSF